MDDNVKEVYFSIYCSECKYFNKKDNEEPCSECLSIPARSFSHKPEYFKEK